MDVATTPRRSALAALALLCGAGLAPRPAMAQAASGAPVGPCSPIPDPDGDIRSELPGCGRHARPVPGSLDDELAFRRRRRDPGGGDTPSHRRRPDRDGDDDETE